MVVGKLSAVGINTHSPDSAFVSELCENVLIPCVWNEFITRCSHEHRLTGPIGLSWVSD